VFDPAPFSRVTFVADGFRDPIPAGYKGSNAVHYALSRHTDESEKMPRKQGAPFRSALPNVWLFLGGGTITLFKPNFLLIRLPT